MKNKGRKKKPWHWQYEDIMDIQVCCLAFFKMGFFAIWPLCEWTLSNMNAINKEWYSVYWGSIGNSATQSHFIKGILTFKNNIGPLLCLGWLTKSQLNYTYSLWEDLRTLEILLESFSIMYYVCLLNGKSLYSI